MRLLLVLAGAGLVLASALSAAPGENPTPVVLVRPIRAPLSAMARLGRLVFFDPRLSSSGQLSCASCHSPAHAYAAPVDAPVMNGGPHRDRQGTRAVPSLMYLERRPAFSIGPDDPESEGAPAPTASALVPQGGLLWDGRADTLQSQALFPLLSPLEMDAGSVGRVAGKLRSASYAARFTELFGPGILRSDRGLVGEALFAVARYEFEDPSFHPYSSRFDAWLEGKARFTPAEQRGYALFNDPKRANCAACHLDRPSPDGLPPLFTDAQYAALGVPRNRTLAVNRDPVAYDLGLCGPLRTDLRTQRQYCGMFATPTLRNVATRRAFFHNGVYRTLQQVLDFYALRAAQPERIYPRGADSRVVLFDDLPPGDRANVDVRDVPFTQRRGERPLLSPQDERDLIAFLRTLTDRGVSPGSRTEP